MLRIIKDQQLMQNYKKIAYCNYFSDRRALSLYSALEFGQFMLWPSTTRNGSEGSTSRLLVEWRLCYSQTAFLVVEFITFKIFILSNILVISFCFFWLLLINIRPSFQFIIKLIIISRYLCPPFKSILFICFSYAYLFIRSIIILNNDCFALGL